MNKNRDFKLHQWQDEKALDRFQMIGPLLDNTLDHAKRVQLRHQIAEQNDLSYKTIKRYDEAWQRDGFDGLHRSGPADIKVYDHTWQDGRSSQCDCGKQCCLAAQNCPLSFRLFPVSLSLRQFMPSRGLLFYGLSLDRAGSGFSRWVLPG